MLLQKWFRIPSDPELENQINDRISVKKELKHMTFKINHVTPVVFGEGTSGQTGEYLIEDGIKKVLCVCDKGVKTAGMTEKILDSIKEKDISIVEFDGVILEPTVETVDEVGNLARQEKVDAVLGIGGGSAMDIAKGVNVLLGNPGSSRDYLKMGLYHQPGKALYLIPTTAGTGSEVTNVAILYNKEAGFKQAIIGSSCAAKVAIVDPELTTSLPSILTAATGMDAFSHAVESYTCSIHNPLSDLLAIEAMSIIVEYLPIAVKDGSNIKARSKMNYASTIAGMAFNSSPTHLGHAIAHAMGSIHHVPHGLGCGLLVPAVLEHLSTVIPDRIKNIAKAMGLKPHIYKNDQETGNAVANAVRKLNSDINLPAFNNLGFGEDELPDIAREATRDICWPLIPKETGVDDTLKLIKREYFFQDT